MINEIQFIEIEGRERGLLLTPSLYKEIKDRGWVIETDQTIENVMLAYQKLFLAAAINYDEVQRFTNPKLPEFNLTLLDINIWAARNPKIFWQLDKDAFELLNETTLVAATKKVKNQKKKFLWLGIITRLKNFCLVLVRQN
jgi:hypothetical protein